MFFLFSYIYYLSFAGEDSFSPCRKQGGSGSRDLVNLCCDRKFDNFITFIGAVTIRKILELFLPDAADDNILYLLHILIIKSLLLGPRLIISLLTLFSSSYPPPSPPS
jgi:hypothetical protein